MQPPQGRGGPPRDQPPGERKGTGTIRGKVTALDTGRPLRRARINVNAPELQETRNVSTGSDGRFEIANLPAGNYSVSVVRGGYLRLGYGQKRPGDPPGRVEVADGQVVSDVNFALPRMSVISGRVFDEVGEPIAGVTVTAQQMRFYEGRRKLVPLGGISTTDDTGQYRLLNLEPGEVLRSHTGARDLGKRWATEGDPGFSADLLPVGTQRRGRATRQGRGRAGRLGDRYFAYRGPRRQDQRHRPHLAGYARGRAISQPGSVAAQPDRIHVDVEHGFVQGRRRRHLLVEECRPG